jgi:hypothetical protein
VDGKGYRPYFENYTVDASIYILANRNQASFGSVGVFSEGVICINDFPNLSGFGESIGLFAILLTSF